MVGTQSRDDLSKFERGGGEENAFRPRKFYSDASENDRGGKINDIRSVYRLRSSCAKVIVALSTKMNLPYYVGTNENSILFRTKFTTIVETSTSLRFTIYLYFS